MPTTPQQRNTTRSRSNSLNEIKSEIISSFKEELRQVTSKLDTLINRIQSVENTIASILKTQERQGYEIDSLKEALTKVNEEKLSIFDELEDRDRRKRNLIVSGLHEMEDGSIEERKQSDKSKINHIFHNLTKWDGHMATSISRIGKQRSEGSRILKIVCEDEKVKWEILGRAKLLRKMPTFQNVYINPDLTPKQQDEAKKLRMELRLRRDEGEDVIIRRGKIVRKSPPQNFL